MTDQTTPSRMRSPLWMRLLLGVSLALNLAVAGLATGVAFRVLGPGDIPHPPSIGGAMIRALPASERKAILSRVRDEQGPRSGHRRDIGPLVAALRAEPFVPETVAGIVETQSAHQQAWAVAMQGAWLDQVAHMTPADRQKYADRIEELETHRREAWRKNREHRRAKP